ncbi:aaa family protein [Stylonychia lemnae]|uniref:Aaa family protein n=1 Tax=Stylonychia lemnae TaxID=5949 RepID=A0A078B7I9_STYLE|nr:aaa family protein [Stylonychia lemnae]|eukprot:CDW90465.1 aaa family protein [Stylonychia lemnae]
MLSLWVRKERNGKKIMMQTIAEESVRKSNGFAAKQLQNSSPGRQIRHQNHQNKGSIQPQFNQTSVTGLGQGPQLQLGLSGAFLNPFNTNQHQFFRNAVAANKPNQQKSPRSTKSTINSTSQQASLSTMSKQDSSLYRFSSKGGMSNNSSSIKGVVTSTCCKRKKTVNNADFSEEEMKLNSINRKSSNYAVSVTQSVHTNTTYNENDACENHSHDDACQNHSNKCTMERDDILKDIHTFLNNQEKYLSQILKIGNYDKNKPIQESLNLISQKLNSLTDNNQNQNSNNNELNQQDISVIKSAKLQNDSSTSYQVGLNIFEELSHKYTRDLKQHLKSIRFNPHINPNLECIMTKQQCMSFDDIAGNDYAKEIINETFVLPSIMPQVFKGKARPWQSILLYGVRFIDLFYINQPPGVGKTMLTQAVCYHSKATCFWVSLADITSKFIGENEMDSLGRKRTGNESETERRIKTEFLKQMDMIKNIPEKVSVFATTNMPWELDIAALRRFERKILVPMPDKETRKNVMKLHSGTHHTLTDEDLDFLAEQTEGYSGSDLSTLVNDALMRPIKQLQQATHFKRVEKRELVDQLKNEYYEETIDDEEEDLTGSIWMPVIVDSKTDKQALLKDDPSIKEMDLAAISEKEVFVRKAFLNDFKQSIENCKPTIHVSFLELYAKFLEKYGHADQKNQLDELRKLQQPQYLSYYA